MFSKIIICSIEKVFVMCKNVTLIDKVQICPTGFLQADVFKMSVTWMGWSWLCLVEPSPSTVVTSVPWRLHSRRLQAVMLTRSTPPSGRHLKYRYVYQTWAGVHFRPSCPISDPQSRAKTFAPQRLIFWSSTSANWHEM